MWAPLHPIFWFALGAGCGWLGFRWWPALTNFFMRHAGSAALALVFSICGVFGSGSAQEKHNHAGLGKAGEFYAGWLNPRHRLPDGSRHVSCCDQRDCERAVMIRKNGNWYVRNHKMAPGQDVLIPDSLLENNLADGRESPDGGAHVCLDTMGNPLCAVLGIEG